MDIKVSAKRPSPQDGGARCISVASPDNRSGAVLAVEHVSGMLADGRPELAVQVRHLLLAQLMSRIPCLQRTAGPVPLSGMQTRFVVSDRQAEAVFQAAHLLGIAVQEVGPAGAAQLVQHGERVLEVRLLPASQIQLCSGSGILRHVVSGILCVQVTTNPAYVRLAMVACAEAAWDCGDRMLPIPGEAAATWPQHTEHLHPKGLLAEQVPATRTYCQRRPACHACRAEPWPDCPGAAHAAALSRGRVCLC